ncbi:MAG: GNAT family N-acetyltransferase [Myxococcota bacterium]|nr:GNAT family N-acetyltransferase [Myxococcota bacterium]MDW8361524.1 GNAT family N-acetyltransferase [Myxococcales bacterium]
MSGSIALRPAREEDRERVFRWANDPVSRAASFTPEPIAWETHVAWYARALEGRARRLFVVEHEGEPVGVVRFELSDETSAEAEIGINLAPEARGRGIGTAALREAVRIARGLGLQRLVACIRPDNTASLKLFARAGYVSAPDRVVRGVLARVCVLDVGSLT